MKALTVNTITNSILQSVIFVLFFIPPPPYIKLSSNNSPTTMPSMAAMIITAMVMPILMNTFFLFLSIQCSRFHYYFTGISLPATGRLRDFHPRERALTGRAKNRRHQPKLNVVCFVVQSCLADADFVVFSNYCLIGTRHMFVRFLWMLQTVKYPQRSKLSTFHTLSKVLKLHMSFNTVPILWLEGRAGMVRAS